MNRVLANHLQRLLAYHGWAYMRLCGQLASLNEEQYRAPCGLFFGSIHGTLNHLAVADRLWLARARFEAQPFERLDEEVVHERAALENFLEMGVAGWRNLVEGLEDADLLAPISYRNMAGEQHMRPLAEIIPHLVNHGTHHRGQISAALTAMGQAAPVLDYIYALPELP